MKDFFYKPRQGDSYYFEQLEQDDIRELLNYTYYTLNGVIDATNKCQNKALAQIPVTLTLYGFHFIWLKTVVDNSEIDYRILFWVITALLLIVLSLSFVSVFMKRGKTIPPLSNILFWIKNEKENINNKLYSTLLFRISETEYSLYRQNYIVGEILKYSQYVLLLFIGAIVASFVILI